MAQTYKYPLDIEDKTHLVINAYDYSLPSQTRRENTAISSDGNIEPLTLQRNGPPLFTIKTYIPGGFGDQTSASWEMKNVAFVSNPKDLSFANVTSAFNKMQNEGLIAGAQELARVGTVGAIGQAMAQDLAGGILNRLGAARSTAEAIAGKRIAPNESKIFTGTKPRSLNLNLVMSPHEEREAENMIDIIDLMRRATSPELVRETFAGIFLTYKYPPIFDLFVMNPNSTSAQSGRYVEYQLMALSNFDIKYSNHSNRLEHFPDGIPTSANLSLSFESLFPVFRRGGNWAGKYEAYSERGQASLESRTSAARGRRLGGRV